MLLSCIIFDNLEELNLSHNKISDIKLLKNFKKLKNLDLSYNLINDIQPIKEIIEENKDLKKINLKNNLIKDVTILKENKFSKDIEINLDNNNIIEKDIKEIKDLIINNNSNILKEEKSKENLNKEINSMDNFKLLMNNYLSNQIGFLNQKSILEMSDKNRNYLNNLLSYLDNNNNANNNRFVQEAIRNKLNNIIPRPIVFEPFQSTEEKINIIFKTNSSQINLVTPITKKISDILHQYIWKIGYQDNQNELLFLCRGKSLKTNEKLTVKEFGISNNSIIFVLNSSILNGA